MGSHGLSLHKFSGVFCATLLVAMAWLSLRMMQPTRPTNDGRVLSYLESISGTKTISGQHNREPNSEPAKWTNWICGMTGKYPGLWGGDFLYSQDDINHRGTMIDEAKKQWNNGALVTLTWHVCPPTQAEPCEWQSGIMSDLTDDQWNDLIEEGEPLNGELNEEWKRRIDKIAPYLRDLKDNQVEVLWRPLHEMNADWCWWCGRPGENGSRRLYEITHKYMTEDLGLTNLIWVWNVKDVTPTTTITSALQPYYPDPRYVDVVSLDPWNTGFAPENYAAMLTIAQGKPISIGETARLPAPGELAAQPRWTWFLGWAELVSQSNSDEEIRVVYNDPRIVNRRGGCIWLPLISR